MFGKPLNGANLADLAIQISSEDIPVLKSAYNNMCTNECLEAMAESDANFDAGMNTIELPVEND
jgi:hypothetical protein